MNKAKALFTAGMIVVVAGTSAVCWQLNEKGMFGSGDDSTDTQDSYVVEDENNNYEDDHIYYNEKNNNADNGNGEEADNTGKTAESTTVKDENDDVIENNDGEKQNELPYDIDTTDINEFLSTFSKLYFSENGRYSAVAPDSYELLKFAYLYAVVYNGGSGTVTEYFDDDIGAYNGISFSQASSIINEFFGVTIAEKSVYTEKTYSFFMYKDGYFYTPAADGVGYDNLTVVDAVEQQDDTLTVKFTVYSQGVSCDMSSAEAKRNGQKYAEGNATIVVDGNDYRLESYFVSK